MGKGKWKLDMNNKDEDRNSIEDFHNYYRNLELLPYLIFISLVVGSLATAGKISRPHFLTLQRSLLGMILALIYACKRHFYINAFNKRVRKLGERKK